MSNSASKNDSASSVTAEFQLSPNGATYVPNYIARHEDHVSVAMEDLREFKSSAMEEALQLLVAEFFVAGALWLGIERMVTIDNHWEDPLFIACVFAVITGVILGIFGFRQLLRRKARIDSIILAAENEKKRREDSAQQKWVAANSSS